MTDDIYNEARKLLDCFPLTSFIQLPEIIVDYDGEITFEWSTDTRHVLLVNMKGKNEITYVGLFGTNKVNGREYFDGTTLPPAIIDNLKKTYLIS